MHISYFVSRFSGTISIIKKLFGDVFITGTEAAKKIHFDIAKSEVHNYVRECIPELAWNPLELLCDNS